MRDESEKQEKPERPELNADGVDLKGRAEIEAACPGVFDWREPSDEDIARFHELAKRYGWKTD